MNSPLAKLWTKRGWMDILGLRCICVVFPQLHRHESNYAIGDEWLYAIYTMCVECAVVESSTCTFFMSKY